MRHLLIVLAFSCACAPAQGQRTKTTGASKTLNKRFLDPKLDVDAWKKRFEGESREVFVHRRRIVSALDLKPGMSMADIGAGTGLFEGLFSSGVGDTGRVYAVDISPRFLDHLRARKKREAWSNVEVVTGGERSIRLPENSVDLIFVCDTYHHFSDVAATLASMRKALRPGGRLILIDFHRIPGKSKKWLLKHVRAGMGTFKREILAGGFTFKRRLQIAGLKENYALEFQLARKM